LKLPDLRRRNLQLAFEFVDPLRPLLGRLDYGPVLDFQQRESSLE
jgi:hypothetical protein